MSLKINRVLIPLFVFGLLIFTRQVSTANPSNNVGAYLPIIQVNQSKWLGPYGGYIVSVAMDPTDPNVIYVGTWGAGIFKSWDGGQTWHPFNRGLGNLFINSLAIDPETPTIIYVGTYKDQVYKSIDGGNSWAWSGTGMQDEAVVYSLAIDPQEPYVLYAGTRGISNNNKPPWSGILYKSMDAGETWTKVLTDVGGAEVQDWVYSIAINPTLSNSVYIATHEHGPFHSNDNGNSWYAIDDGVSDYSGRSIVISPAPSGGTTMYYGVWHDQAVYKTLDGGNDWFAANNGILYTKVYGITIDPAQVDFLYLATFNHGVLKSMDAGETWQPAGLQADFIYNITVNPTTSTIVYAGTAGDGLFESWNSGTSWQPANVGIDNAMVTKVLVSPEDSSELFTSVYGAGVYQSKNHGRSWNTMNDGLVDKFVHTLIQNPSVPQILYALTDTGGLYKNDLRTNTGWKITGQGLPFTQEYPFSFPTEHPFTTHDMLQSITRPLTEYPDNQIFGTTLLSMIFAPSNPQIVYLGTGGSGLYKSLDEGASWQSTGLEGESVQGIAVDYSNPNLVYAATLTAGSLKISTNGGDTWTEAKLPVAFYSLATSPSTPGILYTGTSNGIYRYEGSNWSLLGLSGKVVTTIKHDTILTNRIFAGTTSGVYYTNDAGLTWKELDPDLNALTIQSIDLEPTGNTDIYISTKTHGIYYTSMPNK